MELEENEDPTVLNEILNKYQRAGKIANDAMKLMEEKCVVGSLCRDICNDVDAFIINETSKLYRKIKNKGIAYPSTISIGNSVNTMFGYIYNGCVAKLYVGVQVDGYPAVLCKTIFIESNIQNSENVLLMKNAITAVNIAGEAMSRLIKPGMLSTDIYKYITYIAKNYGLHPINIIPTHKSSKDILKSIDFFPSGEEFKIGFNESYNIDIVFSTLKPDIVDVEDYNIYEKTDNIVLLKSKYGRQFLSKLQNFPFDIDNYTSPEDKFGIKECINNNLIELCNVYKNNYDGTIVRCSFTIYTTEYGVLKISKNEQVDYKENNKLITQLLNHPLKTLEHITPPDNCVFYDNESAPK